MNKERKSMSKYAQILFTGWGTILSLIIVLSACERAAYSSLEQPNPIKNQEQVTHKGTFIIFPYELREATCKTAEETSGRGLVLSDCDDGNEYWFATNVRVRPEAQ